MVWLIIKPVFINNNFYRKYDFYQPMKYFGFANNEAVVPLLDVWDNFPDIVTSWVRCYIA